MVVGNDRAQLRWCNDPWESILVLSNGWKVLRLFTRVSVVDPSRLELVTSAMRGR
jgi:hypothetical protein